MHHKDIVTPAPEACVSEIFRASGEKFDAAAASGLWQKIVQHKWILSEKLYRDVGFRTACVDYLENVGADAERTVENRADLLERMGARTMGRDIWETISDTQPPKQIVQKRIILPLVEEALSRKHGVTPPKAIIFFGPPGTGKTHFVKAIAGRLAWWYVEIAPSQLMARGVDRVGAQLKSAMEKSCRLDEAVVFIDEFEELAGSRDAADRVDRSITNEFLKQVPQFKAAPNRSLLVCATNYIRQLDAALLRPGRFDCVIPVGLLDDDGRRTLLSRAIARLHADEIDLDHLVDVTARFTPADLEYLFQRVAQQAFEKEYEEKANLQVTTEMITEVASTIRPTLTERMVEEFREDVETYSRV